MHIKRYCVRTADDSNSLSWLFTPALVPGCVHTNWISSLPVQLMLVTLLPDLWHHLGLDIPPLLPPFVLTGQSWDNQRLNEQPLDVAASSGYTIQSFFFFITFNLKTTRKGGPRTVSSLWSYRSTTDFYDRLQLSYFSLPIFHTSILMGQSLSFMSINSSCKSQLSSLIHAGTLILRMIISDASWVAMRRDCRPTPLLSLGHCDASQPIKHH